MKNGFLLTVALLGLSYSQPANGATPTAYLSAPTNLTQSARAGEHENSAEGNDGIQIEFSHASKPADESWPRYTDNSKTDGAPGEPVLSGSDNQADPTLRASDSGACNHDVLLATVNGLTPPSTLDPGSLLMAGSALIAIGAALKKARKKL